MKNVYTWNAEDVILFCFHINCAFGFLFTSLKQKLLAKKKINLSVQELLEESYNFVFKK